MNLLVCTSSVFLPFSRSELNCRILPHGAGQDIQYCPVTQFLGQLLRLLVCPNEKFGAQIQKHVKELVGHEMSPALYPILFEQIKVIVEKFFDGSGQVKYI
jgi:neurofibromin 1